MLLFCMCASVLGLCLMPAAGDVCQDDQPVTVCQLNERVNEHGDMINSNTNINGRLVEDVNRLKQDHEILQVQVRWLVFYCMINN